MDCVQLLRAWMAEHHDFEVAFNAAFKLAMQAGIPEFEQYDIRTFNDYLDFLEGMLTWVPTEDFTGTNVYYHLCIFYFVIDLPPIKFFQDPILPSSHAPWKFLSQWLIDFAKQMGKFMDTPASVTPESIVTFYTAPSYRMEDYPVPEGGWKTFNEFFARHIDPAKRPIASPDDPTVVVSPADCAYSGSWPVNSDAIVRLKHLPWSISQLLEDSTYGPQFAGGTFTHSFLGPTDYHRQHAPVTGEILEAKIIPGLCYLEVTTKREPETGRTRLHMHRNLNAPDSPGYQFLQARALILIKSAIGLVAVLPIGMAQISSVVLSVKAGDFVMKGQELSYFQCGGSDIVTVFQEAAKVQLPGDDKINVHYNFGTQVGTASIVESE